MVKALDLSSNGQMSAWVRTPLLVVLLLVYNEKLSFVHVSIVFRYYNINKLIIQTLPQPTFYSQTYTQIPDTWYMFNSNTLTLCTPNIKRDYPSSLVGQSAVLIISISICKLVSRPYRGCDFKPHLG